MRLLIAVALGGAMGSVARWGVAGWMERRADALSGWAATFPVGTLTVNALGCLAIGFLATLFEQRLAVDPAIRAGALVGLLGGFTTFSTFGWETLALLREGSAGLAFLNAAGSVLVGLGGVWGGLALARFVGGVP